MTYTITLECLLYDILYVDSTLNHIYFLQTKDAFITLFTKQNFTHLNILIKKNENEKKK